MGRHCWPEGWPWPLLSFACGNLGNHVGWDWISPLLEWNKQLNIFPCPTTNTGVFYWTQLGLGMPFPQLEGRAQEGWWKLVKPSAWPKPRVIRDLPGRVGGARKKSHSRVCRPRIVLEGRSTVWINICSSDLFMTFTDSPLSLGPRMVVLESDFCV